MSSDRENHINKLVERGMQQKREEQSRSRPMQTRGERPRPSTSTVTPRRRDDSRPSVEPRGRGGVATGSRSGALSSSSPVRGADASGATSGRSAAGPSRTGVARSGSSGSSVSRAGVGARDSRASRDLEASGASQSRTVKSRAEVKSGSGVGSGVRARVGSGSGSGDKTVAKPKPVPSSVLRSGAAEKKAVKTEASPLSEAYPDRNIWMSLGLLFVAGYLGLCCMSYLVYWDVDQSVAQWGRLFAGLRDSVRVMNWGGRLGAILSQKIMGEGFGVFGLLLPVSVFLLAIQVLRIPSFRVRKGAITTLLLMILGSVVMGHFWGSDLGLLGGGLGGEIGVFAASWLGSMVGFEGTTLLVLVLFAAMVYFAASDSVRLAVHKIVQYIEKQKELQAVKAELERIKQEEAVHLAALRNEHAKSALIEKQEQEANKLRSRLGSAGADSESGVSGAEVGAGVVSGLGSALSTGSGDRYDNVDTSALTYTDLPGSRMESSVAENVADSSGMQSADVGQGVSSVAFKNGEQVQQVALQEAVDQQYVLDNAGMLGVDSLGARMVGEQVVGEYVVGNEMDGDHVLDGQAIGARTFGAGSPEDDMIMAQALGAEAFEVQALQNVGDGVSGESFAAGSSGVGENTPDGVCAAAANGVRQGARGYFAGYDALGKEIVYYWLGSDYAVANVLPQVSDDDLFGGLAEELEEAEFTTSERVGIAGVENLDSQIVGIDYATSQEMNQTQDAEYAMQNAAKVAQGAAMAWGGNQAQDAANAMQNADMAQNANGTQGENVMQSVDSQWSPNAAKYSVQNDTQYPDQAIQQPATIQEQTTDSPQNTTQHGQSQDHEMYLSDNSQYQGENLQKEYFHGADGEVVTRFSPSKEDPNFIVEQKISEMEVDDNTINLTELYDPTLELASYTKPPIELMDNHMRNVNVSEEELIENKNRIVTTLENFGIKIDTIEATIGPTVTLYEIIPAPGVRISKIKNLEDDIALSLSALGIRIIAPIPGKGTIGIEVPNKDKEVVSMYSVIKSAKFQDSKAELPIALGKTIQNETFVLDLAKMPHLLVAGATGQGKSVGLNAIITSLLYKKHPSELKFVLVDPKKVELTLYSRLEKHFLAKLPDATEAIITDTQKVIYTLNSLCIEMDSRYDLLKAAKVRNIIEYNDKFINRRLNPNKGHRFLPYFVVVVDEFADLIMTAGREVETPIARIAQLARAVGIHLIIATQRPTTNIITGVIKANFPARIAFRVSSMVDSRTILDSPGANQLVGKGDMLVSTGSEVTRVQCAFIDTPEVDRIAEHIGSQRGYPTAYELPEYVPEGEATSSLSSEDMGKRDSLFEEVARYVVANDNGSASTIQRKFSIGFNRAGRIVDQLEAAGILGRPEGSKPRQVLIQDPMSLEMLLDNL